MSSLQARSRDRTSPVNYAHGTDQSSNMTRLADLTPDSHVECGDTPFPRTAASVNPAPGTADPIFSGLYASPASMASSATAISSSGPEHIISEDISPTPSQGDTPLLGSPNLGEQPEISSSGRLPLKESLGRTGSVTIFGGSALILISIGFLSLLWFGYGDEPEGAKAPWLWRRIAVNDWMTRAITISALVLRSVVSIQVALCTSMTAALVLEKRSARKSDVAYLSIARSTSDGPRKVAQLLVTSRSWSVLAYVELWLICLLALVSLALQFSSTLLLSDIHDFVIVSNAEARPVANFGTFDVLQSDGVQAPLLQNDPIYAIFGEERSSADITPSESGFSDTGVIRRGFLPFQGSKNRTSVRKYQGSTLVTNSHIVCVPPLIKGRFVPRGEGIEWLGVGHMVGALNYSGSIRQAREGLGPLCAGHKCESVVFECSIPGSPDASSPQSNFCFVETVGNTTRAIANHWTYGPLSYLNMEAEPWSPNSTMYLVSKSNVAPAGWDHIVNAQPIPAPSRNGEWSTYEISSGQTVDISLCFTRFYTQARYVDMIAEEPTHEPVVTWNGGGVEHDTRMASAFVGLETPIKPPRERGLMDMNILSLPDPAIPDGIGTYGLAFPELSANVIQTILLAVVTNSFIPGSISGCFFCQDYSFSNSQAFNLLFTDTIESSGRAAAALHTYFAICAMTIYDTYLSGFNVTETVQLATTISIRTPGPCSKYQCTGFISVTTLLGVHLVIVMIITTVFVAQARYSRCSNTWHAVAQLMASEELAGVLDRSNNAKDDVITENLRADNKDDFVKLGRTNGSNRVQVLGVADKAKKKTRKTNGQS
ncbi:hypothetical protein F5B22DRAFT_571499 [Xylaria bambusicola]|uniref:uncharacterized protein n=1 Tax=Xylaria bambusicola TaxID=326684 RepID=UPI002007A485|nr:uncharacterized protein F5B22DRAFT_571499 [Xylaria bambusicola]KAI0521385.1 hypothetical protein F5B22DRAFT_571499 [Xylaria bambusicola]